MSGSRDLKRMNAIIWDHAIRYRLDFRLKSYMYCYSTASSDSDL